MKEPKTDFEKKYKNLVMHHESFEVLKSMTRRGKDAEAFQYATSLRGPDVAERSCCSAIKDSTTAFLRGENYYADGINDVESALDEFDSPEGAKEFKSQYLALGYHWSGHIQQGFTALSEFYEAKRNMLAHDMCHDLRRAIEDGRFDDYITLMRIADNSWR